VKRRMALVGTETTAYMLPSIPQLLDFFVRLEDSPEGRTILDGMPHQIFQAAVREGLLEELEQDGFANLVGKAVKRELIEFERTQAGIGAPGPVWGDHDFQMRSGYYVTVSGRQMAELFRGGAVGGRMDSVDNARSEETEMRDCFICHASEDKKDVARPLAEALRRRKYSVWFDEYEIELGDSLRGKIDQGLAESHFGVVILSKRFFEKEWTQRELDGLAARETIEGKKRILPVWHRIDAFYLAQKSPTLADRAAVKSEPLSGAVDAIATAINRRRSGR
jgi:hypothetical protein